MEVISYIALIVVVIALVVLGVVGALELSQHYFKWEVKITDIDKYLKTNGFLSEFSIFPESLDGITGVNEYHYYDGGNSTGQEIFLEIVYSPEVLRVMSVIFATRQETDEIAAFYRCFGHFRAGVHLLG